jgi:hypothetical protein
MRKVMRIVDPERHETIPDTGYSYDNNDNADIDPFSKIVIEATKKVSPSVVQIAST